MQRCQSLLLCLAIGTAVLVPIVVEAKMKPEYASSSDVIKDWFHTQRDGNGRSCCDQADGHYYDGNYNMNSDGSVDVAGHHLAPYQVLNGSNPTHHAVWWYAESLDSGHPYHTDYCFAPGPGM